MFSARPVRCSVFVRSWNEGRPDMKIKVSQILTWNGSSWGDLRILHLVLDVCTWFSIPFIFNSVA